MPAANRHGGVKTPPYILYFIGKHNRPRGAAWPPRGRGFAVAFYRYRTVSASGLRWLWGGSGPAPGAA